MNSRLFLERWLSEHEGIRLYPYKCTSGKLTIGIGRNLDSRGITFDEAHYMLKNDIKRFEQELTPYDFYSIQPDHIKACLINMCFNMGLSTLLKFKKMIAALEKLDYDRAAEEALDSRWAHQVGYRARDIASVMRNGSPVDA